MKDELKYWEKTASRAAEAGTENFENLLQYQEECRLKQELLNLSGVYPGNSVSSSATQTDPGEKKQNAEVQTAAAPPTRTWGTQSTATGVALKTNLESVIESAVMLEWDSSQVDVVGLRGRLGAEFLHALRIEEGKMSGLLGFKTTSEAAHFWDKVENGEFDEIGGTTFMLRGRGLCRDCRLWGRHLRKILGL
jgi:hypothetical protein